MMQRNCARSSISASKPIESGYEFMLAYAAQGRETDKGAAAGRNVREYLDKMAAALDGLGSVVAACAYSVDSELREQRELVLLRGGLGCARSRTAPCGSCSSRPDISSQLVDNLNASIHLRALLTDLFVVDEALKPPDPES